MGAVLRLELLAALLGDKWDDYVPLADVLQIKPGRQPSVPTDVGGS